MTNIDETALNSTPETTQDKAAFSSVTAPLRQLFRAASRRHTAMPMLVDADPHVLKDIGITPQDVYAASASRWWEDPTGKLADYAQTRRRA